MKKTLFFFFILLSLCGYSQKESSITVKGIVTDTFEKPIPNVNISILGSSKGTKTDVNGVFYLRITEKVTALKFSHISYYNRNKRLVENIVNDTLHTLIQLTQKTNQLEAFQIIEEKIKLIYNKNFVPIYDYEFYEDKLLLLVKELNVTKLRLTWSNQQELENLIVPNNTKIISMDCFGNIHLLNKDSAYQIEINENKMRIIFRIHINTYNSFLKPCIAEVNSALVFKEERGGNNIAYYYYDQEKGYTYLKKMEDNHYNRFSSRRRIAAKKLSYPSISKMSEDSASVKIARRLINEINFLDFALKHSNDSPLFSIKNSVYIFDHSSFVCWIYDENLDFQKSIPINYHKKIKWDKKRWKKELILDKEQGEVYAQFEKGGLCYLKKIDLSTGETVESYKLEKHTYPINIKIKDNTVYYLYKDHFNNGDMSLFRQSLY